MNLAVSAEICYDPVLLMGNFVGRIMARGINRLPAKAVETTKGAGLVADGAAFICKFPGQELNRGSINLSSMDGHARWAWAL